MNVLGDFQTPPALAALVVEAVRRRGVAPARILEPTCGGGAFLAAAAAAFPRAREIQGIEYQRERYAPALAALAAADARVRVTFADAYASDFAALEWAGAGELLALGNPPWVTTAALGAASTPAPQPPRSRATGLRGLAARTGAANFDVAEYLLRKLLRECAPPLTAAFLVKSSVARKVAVAAFAAGAPITSVAAVRIDARRWFGVAVDACALIVTAGPGERATRGAWHDDFDAPPAGWFELAPPPAPPASPWRQGLKHDAAAVFELRRTPHGWCNGYGTPVEIEDAFRFPLRKARALHAGDDDPDCAVIVPQRRLGEPTADLPARAPLLARYLAAHAERLRARKSSIYAAAPPYALFGIGPYSFAPWKVAVAGLYAVPRFRLLGPCDGRPVMLGDTSYFVPFAAAADAHAFLATCESAPVRAALAARVVRGKRPITKALLDGIEWGRLPAFEREAGGR